MAYARRASIGKANAVSVITFRILFVYYRSMGIRPTLDFLATVGFALSAFAQTGADPTRFRVASIRPAVPQEVSGCIGTMCGGPRTNDPAFSYLAVPLVSVLEWAYGKPT